jgi:hypothetical protein
MITGDHLPNEGPMHDQQVTLLMYKEISFLIYLPDLLSLHEAHFNFRVKPAKARRLADYISLFLKMKSQWD